MILETLAEAARRRVEAAKRIVPLADLQAQIYDREKEIKKETVINGEKSSNKEARSKEKVIPNEEKSSNEEKISNEKKRSNEEKSSNQEKISNEKKSSNEEKCTNEKLTNEEKVKRVLRHENFAFEKVLRRQEGISFICEVKKAAPSKGIIVSDFPYQKIAVDYEAAGARAISVLTEPEYFKGSEIYLQEISATVSIPVLRKDFIIDEYQLYESKWLGADAVLLICALLETERLKKFKGICDELGLSALVEAYTKEEVAMAIEAGARVIGVNNRNLKTFEVDLRNCLTLRELVPAEISYVAESGIQTREQISLLEKAGVDAVLIGEVLMRSTDKKALLTYLKGKGCQAESCLRGGKDG